MSLPLPAHRFEDRKKKKDDTRTVVFDFDETITKAPDHVAFIATALRQAGCRIIVLTGNQSARHELLDELNDYGMPFDELVQYHDDGTDGIERAEYLKQLDAYIGVDNRIDRSPVYTKVCPHLFVVARPPRPARADAKGTKHDAKHAAEQVAKSLQ